jgi:hypothetical protein
VRPENLPALVINWWNTSLSPPGASIFPVDEDAAFVADQIREMRVELKFALIGLCEVETQDLEKIVRGVGDPALRILDTTSRAGKMKFDTAMTYDVERLVIRFPIPLFRNSELSAGYRRATSNGRALNIAA